MTAKDLKNALLQEAVQGKLVPQIASEGNARDLLEEIRKERGESLPLASARKRSSATPSAGSNAARNARFAPITEDEIPFDIPENWCWCRITDIATCELGKTKDALKNKGVMKDYLCSINIQEEGIDLSKVKQMKFEESEFERYTVKKNDLLICEGGDAGRCAIYDNDEPMYYQNALHRIRFFYNLNPKFYLYVFQVYKANKILSEASKGVTIQHLTGTALKELYFPLPPLAEQKRIVSALEKFMPVIEEYGKKETELKALNEQIGTLTKKAILQEAVQGKLVPQIAAEGNAKDLLQEIKKEKVKVAGKASSTSFASKTRAKEFPPITDDEIPFDIPENWCWCRLGEIVQLTSGQDLQREMYNSLQKGIPYITGASNFDNGQILINRWTETPKSIAIKDDLLLTCKGTVGEMAFLKEKKVHIARQVMSIRSSEKISLGYVKHYLTTQIENLKSKAKSMIPGIARDDVMSSLFPLPPLAEQKRIVAAIEKMLPLCEKFGE